MQPQHPLTPGSSWVTLSPSFFSCKMATPSYVMRIKQDNISKLDCQQSGLAGVFFCYRFQRLGREIFFQNSKEQCGPAQRAWAWMTSGKPSYLSKTQFPQNKVG